LSEHIHNLINKADSYTSPNQPVWSANSGQKKSLPEQNSQALKLSKLAEAAQALTACRTTHQVINQVLDSIMAAIETADSGIFYLYDENSGFLTVQSARGFNNNIYEMKIRPGEIMSGKAFASGKAGIYHTLEESLKAGDNFTQPNESVFYDASAGRTPISALIAPLILKDEPIGVIVLDNFSVEHAFTTTDLDLLQLLANQAAVAIDNVRLYEHQNQLLYRLEQALRIHNNLTQTVLQGRGIDGIVADLSQLIENPVIFFDRNAEVQSISQLELPKPLLEYLKNWLSQNLIQPAKLLLPHQDDKGAVANSAGFRASFAKTAPLETKNTLTLKLPGTLLNSADGEFTVLVSPVNVGGEELGWVMAIPFLRPINEGESLALEYAATIFGLECIKQQAIFEVQARSKADLIDDLLAGRLSAALDRRARELGLDFEAPIVCIYIDIDNFSRYIETHQLAEKSVQSIKARIYQKLDLLIKSTNSVSFIGTKSDSFIVFWNLLSVEPLVWKASVRKIAGDLQNWIKDIYPQLSVSVAISGVYSGSSAMLTALNETQRVLELYQNMGRTNSIFFTEEIGADQILLQLPDNHKPQAFIETTLAPLLEYDKNNHTDLLATLATYCAHNRSIPETAKALTTHANTVRYRIERINELLGDALKDSEGFFNIELALRLLRLQGKLLYF
jgi:sugar diacid utilization regulator